MIWNFFNVLLFIVLFIGVYLSFLYLITYFSQSDEEKEYKTTNMPYISIIVPAYNEERTIGKTINSLLQLQYPKDKLEVIIVDDGIATGYTAMVAGLYAKNKGARKIILAVPVCPEDSINRVKDIFDEVICYEKVDTPFFAVGAFYRDFHQVSDEEVKEYEEKALREGLFI